MAQVGTTKRSSFALRNSYDTKRRLKRSRPMALSTTKRTPKKTQIRKNDAQKISDSTVVITEMPSLVEYTEMATNQNMSLVVYNAELAKLNLSAANQLPLDVFLQGNIFKEVDDFLREFSAYFSNLVRYTSLFCCIMIIAAILIFLYLRFVLSWFVYPTFRLLFGYVYPAYGSYKAVRGRNGREYVKWMMYWIVFALFIVCETVTDIFLSWFPFYYEFKVCVVLWLLSPATKGSSILYRKFVHPALERREHEIDEYLNHVKERGYSAVMDIGTKSVNMATNYLVQTALKGGGNLVQTIRRSYSLTDLSEPDLQRTQDEVDEVSALLRPMQQRMLRQRMPTPLGRSASSTGGRHSTGMYFTELDVAGKSSSGDINYNVRSSEDISSGYSSIEQIHPSNLMTLSRTSSMSSASKTRLKSKRAELLERELRYELMRQSSLPNEEYYYNEQDNIIQYASPPLTLSEFSDVTYDDGFPIKEEIATQNNEEIGYKNKIENSKEYLATQASKTQKDVDARVAIVTSKEFHAATNSQEAFKRNEETETSEQSAFIDNNINTADIIKSDNSSENPTSSNEDEEVFHDTETEVSIELQHTQPLTVQMETDAQNPIEDHLKVSARELREQLKEIRASFSASINNSPQLSCEGKVRRPIFHNKGKAPPPPPPSVLEPTVQLTPPPPPLPPRTSNMLHLSGSNTSLASTITTHSRETEI